MWSLSALAGDARAVGQEEVSPLGQLLVRSGVHSTAVAGLVQKSGPSSEEQSAVVLVHLSRPEQVLAVPLY